MIPGSQKILRLKNTFLYLFSTHRMIAVRQQPNPSQLDQQSSLERPKRTLVSKSSKVLIINPISFLQSYKSVSPYLYHSVVRLLLIHLDLTGLESVPGV